jgi:predicted Fe-Mo cluster-binding NifX family protein
MKVAISSTGPSLADRVDPRFGRAACFIVYDTENDEFEAIGNEQNVMAAQGAGVQAAQTVAGQKVALVVSGNIGPKAFAVLSAADVKVATWAKGTVAEAVELVKQGRLTAVDQPTKEGHWS